MIWSIIDWGHTHSRCNRHSGKQTSQCGQPSDSIWPQPTSSRASSIVNSRARWTRRAGTVVELAPRYARTTISCTAGSAFKTDRDRSRTIKIPFYPGLSHRFEQHLIGLSTVCRCQQDGRSEDPPSGRRRRDTEARDGRRCYSVDVGYSIERCFDPRVILTCTRIDVGQHADLTMSIK